MSAIFPELIAIDLEAENFEEAIKKGGKLFYDNGYVKDTYIDAVIAREKIYPTGLQLKDIAVAMPHTDPQHVNKAAVCVIKLLKPVTFLHMGEDVNNKDATKVEAEMLFMMSILNPNEQVETLQKVLSVFQNPDIVDDFKKAYTKEELYEIAKKHIG